MNKMLNLSNTQNSDKIRLFYLYHDFLNIMPIHTFEVITQLAKNGHEVFLFGCIDRNALFLNDLQYLMINIIRVPYWPIRGVGEAFFLFCLLMKITINIFKHRPNIIYIRHGSLSVVGAIIRRIFRIPICIEVNDILLRRTEYKKLSLLKSFWIRIYEKLSFSLADRVFPVTENISTWTQEKYSVKKRFVVTIPNGVNIKRFYPMDLERCRKKFNIQQNKFVVGYLGSLFHWAGIEYLIEAAEICVSNYQNLFFAIGGGEQPYLSQLKQKVHSKNLNKYFNFYGPVRWSEASEFINTFDIGVAPVFFKNLESGISSQKVFAYLSCGKPVIGSNICGLGDFLEKEGIGISFPMGNSVALSKVIMKFIQNNEKVKIMGKKAKTFVAKNCSWEIIVNQLEKHISELIENYRQ